MEQQAQKEFLTMSLENIDRLSRMINDLLDISKIESGRVSLQKVQFDITAVAKHVCESFRSRVQEAGLEINETFQPEPFTVFADRDKIFQVFTNLIGNALKFTKKGYIESDY